MGNEWGPSGQADLDRMNREQQRAAREAAQQVKAKKKAAKKQDRNS